MSNPDFSSFSPFVTATVTSGRAKQRSFSNIGFSVRVFLTDNNIDFERNTLYNLDIHYLQPGAAKSRHINKISEPERTTLKKKINESIVEPYLSAVTYYNVPADVLNSFILNLIALDEGKTFHENEKPCKLCKRKNYSYEKMCWWCGISDPVE